jgi:hypothetical protein
MCTLNHNIHYQEWIQSLLAVNKKIILSLLVSECLLYSTEGAWTVNSAKIKLPIGTLTLESEQTLKTNNQLTC